MEKEKEFVPYDLAAKLKALGFNEPCIGNNWWGSDGIFNQKYDLGNTIKAPTFSQAFRWFRENYNIVGEINSYYSDKKWSFNYDVVTIFKEKASDRFNTYEEAELALLNKLIQIVESKS